MKNLMIANLSLNKRYSLQKIDTLIKAQIENSLELGWRAKDIILLANFDYRFMGIKSKKIFSNSKMLLINNQKIIWLNTQ